MNVEECRTGSAYVSTHVAVAMIQCQYNSTSTVCDGVATMVILVRYSKYVPSAKHGARCVSRLGGVRMRSESQSVQKSE
jgi:hypothetical protein